MNGKSSFANICEQFLYRKLSNNEKSIFRKICGKSNGAQMAEQSGEQMAKGTGLSSDNAYGMKNVTSYE